RGEEREEKRGKEGKRDGEGAGGEAADEEVARIEHRLTAPELPHDEERKADEPAAEQCKRERTAPAVIGAFDRPEDDGRQRDDRQQRADRVEARGTVFPRGGDDRERGRERDPGEGARQGEDRRPGEEGQEDAPRGKT